MDGPVLTPWQLRPVPLFLVVQGGAFAAAVLLVHTLGSIWPGQQWLGWLLQPLLAVWCCRALAWPRWWQVLHAVFFPLVGLCLWLALPAWLYGIGLLGSLAIFGAAYQGRVPLYLTSDAALEPLCRVLADLPRGARFADIGCGVGTTLASAKRARPDLDCVGYEAAWIPWALAALRGRLGGQRYRVRRADFWRESWADFDAVYSYLSPAPMPAVWQKASVDLRRGATLISNMFPVPDVAADQVLDYGAAGDGKLYVWKIR